MKSQKFRFSLINLSCVFILQLCVLILFAGCSKKNQNSSASENKNQTEETPKNVEIKLGFSTNMQDPRAEASTLFKTIVEQETAGRIKVNLYSDGVLGSDAELINSVINNTVDMTISSAGNYASYVAVAGYSAMPFLFSDFEDAWAFLDGEQNKKINQAFEAYNMVVLAYFDNGFRCVTTSQNQGPVKKVSDMDGLIIRTSQNQIVMETMVSLNADPQVYPFAELKEALKNGMFNAQENPIPVIYNNKLYEVQKYLAITNHSYDAMPVTIRKQLWDSLSQGDKDIIMNAAKRAQTLNRTIVSDQTKNYITELEKTGMVITRPDLGEFKKATEGVFDVFAPIYGDLLEQK